MPVLHSSIEADMPPGRLPQVLLDGVGIHRLTEVQAVARIIRAAAAGQGGWVITPNLDFLRRMALDIAFRRLCDEADLVVADGMPLVWASRVQGTPLPQRVAGSDLIWSLSAAAAEAGLSVFFLGGNPGVAEAAARILIERNPTLLACGTHCPAFGFEQDEGQLRAMEEILRSTRPRIVFVALGSPKQERLIAQLRRELPDCWFLGVGISFSFVCGDVRRAPAWMRRGGLEWVHRLLQEPQRLARRYLVEDLPYALRLFARALTARIRRECGSPQLTSALVAPHGNDH